MADQEFERGIFPCSIPTFYQLAHFEKEVKIFRIGLEKIKLDWLGRETRVRPKTRKDQGEEWNHGIPKTEAEL